MDNRKLAGLILADRIREINEELDRARASANPDWELIAQLSEEAASYFVREDRIADGCQELLSALHTPASAPAPEPEPEQKTHRAHPFRWTQLAVAAAVAGFAVFGAAALFRRARAMRTDPRDETSVTTTSLLTDSTAGTDSGTALSGDSGFSTTSYTTVTDDTAVTGDSGVTSVTGSVTGSTGSTGGTGGTGDSGVTSVTGSVTGSTGSTGGTGDTDFTWSMTGSTVSDPYSTTVTTTTVSTTMTTLTSATSYSDDTGEYTGNTTGGWDYSCADTSTVTTLHDTQKVCRVQIYVVDESTGEPVSNASLFLYDTETGSLVEWWLSGRSAEVFQLDPDRWYRIEIKSSPSGKYQSDRVFKPSQLESDGSGTYRLTLKLR